MFVRNCLTKEECEIMEDRFLKYIKDYPDVNHDKYIKKYPDENGDDLVSTTNSYGICFPFKKLQIDHKQILSRFSNLIKENYKTNYKFSHSFLRIYYYDSMLKLHNDKETLDLTLSVNIGGIENWPIHISNIHTDIKDICPGCDEYEELCNKFKKDYHSVITPKGCGVFCSGGEYVHWRDPLQCEPDEYAMQIFFHWTKC